MTEKIDNKNETTYAQEKTIYKRWWFILLIVLVIGIVVGNTLPNNGNSHKHHTKTSQESKASEEETSDSEDETTTESTTTETTTTTTSETTEAPFNPADYPTVDFNQWNHDKLELTSKLQITGKVVQFQKDSDGAILRVAVGDNYNTIAMVYISDYKYKEVIAEDDNVTIYGVNVGLTSYTSTL